MKPCRSAINGKSFQLLHLGTRPQTRRVGGNLERKLVAGHEMMSFLLVFAFVFRSCWMAMLNAIGNFFDSIFCNMFTFRIADELSFFICWLARQVGIL